MFGAAGTAAGTTRQAASTLKAHITRTHTHTAHGGGQLPTNTRNNIRKEAQEKLTHITCEDEDIENVWVFKYLGSRFRADGDQ